MWKNKQPLFFSIPKLVKNSYKFLENTSILFKIANLPLLQFLLNKQSKNIKAEPCRVWPDQASSWRMYHMIKFYRKWDVEWLKNSYITLTIERFSKLQDRSLSSVGANYFLSMKKYMAYNRSFSMTNITLIQHSHWDKDTLWTEILY